jgi:4-azaleucine resistance transporter AzlC
MRERGTATTVSFGEGVREALPIVFGYVPIGFAYGVLGRTAGLPTWAIVAMCVLVYAGSAQFLAVGLIAQGASPATIIATTFIVNLRHLLYSSSIAPRLLRMSRGKLAWVAAELTDESFVMASRAAGDRMRILSFPFMTGLQGTAQVSWVLGSLGGALAGSFIGDPSRLGLDYALVAMFIGLLALQMHGRREVLVASVAGGLSLGLHLVGVGSIGVIPVTIVASLVGLLFKPQRQQTGEPGSLEEAE